MKQDSSDSHMNSEQSEEFIIIFDHFHILHPAYRSTITDGQQQYRSVEQFWQCRVLLYFNKMETAKLLAMEDSFTVAVSIFLGQLTEIEKSSETSAHEITEVVRTLRREGLYQGYLLRYSQDEEFKKFLLKTSGMPIIYADPIDAEFGIGMSAFDFVQWTMANNIIPQKLLECFRMESNSEAFFKSIGVNQIGRILMIIRDEENISSIGDRMQFTSNEGNMPKFLSSYWFNTVYEFEHFGVTEQFTSLSGAYLPLSIFYPTPIVCKKKRYHSVAHYVYFKWFVEMNCNDKQIELLLTTSNPTYLPVVAKKALSKQESLLNDYKLFINWLEQGLFLKFQQYPSAVSLLMSTGDSLLVETVCGKRDCFLSCGMTEDEFSEFLAVSSVSVYEVFKKMVKPTSVCEKPFNNYYVGRNFSGLTLMRYRQYVCQKKSAAHSGSDNLQSSVESEGSNVAGTKTEEEDVSYALSGTTGALDQNVYPFTRHSILHPQYYAPIIQKDTAVIYPSAYHMVFMESCLYFGFPSKARAVLARESSENVFALFNSFISRWRPDVDILMRWNESEFYNLLKTACRLKLEQHADLKQFLKQTGNALLVYCNRLTAGMLNLSVGMCVDDFLNWKNICQVDNVKLTKEMLKPYDKRLCYLGGNRLGFLLMELRKEMMNSENKKLISEEASIDMTMEEALGLAYDDCGVDEASYGAPIQLWRNPYDLLMMSIEEQLKGLADESTAAASSGNSPKLSHSSDMSRCLNEIQRDEATVHDIDENRINEMTDVIDFYHQLNREWRSEMKNIQNSLESLADYNEEVTRDTAFRKSVAEKNSAEEEEEEIALQDTTAGIRKLHNDPNINQNVMFFEAGFMQGLKSGCRSGQFLRVDWTEPKAQSVLNRTWYHLTVRERDSAQSWLASQLKDLSHRSGSRRSLDVRHFVPVQPAEPIRWVEPVLVNLSIRDEVIESITSESLLSKSPTSTSSHAASPCYEYRLKLCD
ncbi:hypothetical protein T4A_3542 [Trichinella pseudospiralis]|uniref:NADAR domain-containing protein n=1 Tax=Trichinella pseudospiralis TaxID=6337 RepID=A0A0V1EKF4_TRIPS|nr:hypothetical protein T4A_3542 [Trichinella pseudospiralis]KRY74273.1 hypothetical protein T4A_3542 [Trichinella pseudospiralis]